jgi:hypothetical protein
MLKYCKIVAVVEVVSIQIRDVKKNKEEYRHFMTSGCNS